ncbi:MAG: NifB/NifX family molybdenum-iron cluster-binding protein [Thermoplasmata archaeon]|nr:NifB/NifX family molybdenum-iron cluster-binding protein [Thermoplasmata archaeon]
MKLCIPSMGNRGLDEQMGYHFGRVPYYTIVDTDTDEVKVVPNTSAHMGGQGYPAEILANLDIHTMIVGGLGRRAIQLFEQNGVMVYVGASGTVREALTAFRNNRLEAATDENACRQHAFHGEGIGEGHEHHH